LIPGLLRIVGPGFPQAVRMAKTDFLILPDFAKKNRGEAGIRKISPELHDVPEN